jgi:heme/copper-type cytochrome/quinol oxidase subunit 2
MNKKEIIIIGAAVAIVAIGLGIYYWSGASRQKSPATNVQTTSTTSTIQPLPTGTPIIVPTQNATSVPAGVAAPTIVASGSLSGVTSYRSFNISISGGAFSPNTIIVNKGDTVHINLTAVDGNYDFTQTDMGLSMAVAKGQTKIVQFDANTVGKLTFYCKSCGGPGKGPIGYIEVVGK